MSMSRPFLITAGEALWLHRRRAGATMAVWGINMFGCPEDTVYKTEHDLREPPAVLRPLLRFFSRTRPITPGEYSALMRRRAGKTMAWVAQKRRSTRTTVWKQEHDKTQTAPDLAHWWSLQAVKGPPAGHKVYVKHPEDR